MVNQPRDEPVIAEGEGDREPDDTIGLALSGGGYRAMLFHAGSLIRLFELGVLQRTARISSVSGGSITAAKLALEWPKLSDRAALIAYVIEPIREMARTSIDVSSVLIGTFVTGNVGHRISAAYAHHLFGDKTLQDLPDAPVFVINATNVETGSLFRFSKKRARDWRVGEIAQPRFRLADAVTASSAFPPVLSPFILETRPSDFTTREEGVDPAFFSDISLTDGGVYDNLGLETIYKRCRTVLCSNGGGTLPWDASPPADWLHHTRRVIDIIHGQVSSVRTRQLIDAYKLDERKGAYWGIGSDIANFPASRLLRAPIAQTRQLANMPTRLTRVDERLQEQIINWGYAVCDAAVRSTDLVQTTTSSPQFPYPASAV